MAFPIQALHSGLIKQGFSCGKDMLDNYLYKQSGQDVKRRLCTVSVMVDGDKIIGYYTLSTTSIARELVPEVVQKKMPPSYYHLPAILLGRLAVDLKYKGRRLGEYLLLDALRVCVETSAKHIGAMAVIVGPLDEDAERFYSKYEFIKLDSGKMFLPVQTIAQLFEN